jgi:D-alanyl-D-alanine carboxypeptidase
MTSASKAGNNLIAVALGASTRNKVVSEIKDLLNFSLKKIEKNVELAKK